MRPELVWRGIREGMYFITAVVVVVVKGPEKESFDGDPGGVEYFPSETLLLLTLDSSELPSEFCSPMGNVKGVLVFSLG